MGIHEMGELMRQRPTARRDRTPNSERRKIAFRQPKNELESAAQVLNKKFLENPGRFILFRNS